MKKILTILFLAVILTALCIPCYAEEMTEAETVATVTNVSGLAGIGVAVVSVIVFVAGISGKLKKILSTLGNAFSSIFGKNGEIKNVPQAFSEIEKIVKEMGEEFKAVLAEEQAKFKALEEEYKKTNKENCEYKQALGIFFLYANNINPYIKNELCRLLQGEIPFKESLEETAKEIEEIVKKIIETDVKAATPNLDAISEAQNENS